MGEGDTKKLKGAIMENQRINQGVLKTLSEVSGVAVTYLSDIASIRKRPGRKTALLISISARSIGINIPPEILIYGGAYEIKKRLNGEWDDEKKSKKN